MADRPSEKRGADRTRYPSHMKYHEFITCPAALQANSLSTATFALDLDKGRQLMEPRPETNALFVSIKRRQVRTTGFPLLS